MRVIIWGCPGETSAPAVPPGGWTPGCPTCPCGALRCAKGQCQFRASCLGLPELNLQLHPELPARSVSLNTRHELILLARPWDCWAKGFHTSIPDSSAIQLAFPPGQAQQHAQVPKPATRTPASTSNIPFPEGSDPAPASPTCSQQDLCTPSRGGTCKERAKAKVTVHQGETSMHFSICQYPDSEHSMVF